MLAALLDTARNALVFLGIYVGIGLLVPPLVRFAAKAPALLPADNPGSERVRIVEDNEEALVVRLQMILGARRRIVVSTFKWTDGPASDDIIAALVGAATRGVQVRIVADGMGLARRVRMHRRFRYLASLENVQMKIYYPVSLLLPWRFNYRMHDKYLIVDDRCLLLGGRNISCQSLGNYTRNQDIDRDALVVSVDPVQGRAMQQLNAYFDRVWRLRACKLVRPHRMSTRVRARVFVQCRLRIAQLVKRYPVLAQPFDPLVRTVAAQRIDVLSNACEPVNKRPVMWNVQLASAQKGTDVVIQTPYIIVGKSVFGKAAHGKAALAGNPISSGEGVLCGPAVHHRSVVLLTNAPEQGANPFGCGEYVNHRGQIAKLGTAVYEWLGGHSMHTKTLLVDDDLSFVGSFNMDYRSIYLDTELMLCIRSCEVNASLRARFLQLRQKSRAVAKHAGITAHSAADGALAFGLRAARGALAGGRVRAALVGAAAVVWWWAKRITQRVFGVVMWPVRYLM